MQGNLYATNEKKPYTTGIVNDKTKEECDRNSSMVIIYPKDPYGQKDYTIDAILVCGFEEKEEK